MKSVLFGLLLSLLNVNVFIAQNPEGFDAMCNSYLSRTVPLVTPKKVIEIKNNLKITLLDAREVEEYKVSHINGAISVGYDEFDILSLKELNKNQPVYVYCSIGYRSEKIGEQLQEAGFKKVYNIYGGLFNWVNLGYSLVDNNGDETVKVHGYNSDWSKWLNEKKCTKVLNH